MAGRTESSEKKQQQQQQQQQMSQICQRGIGVVPIPRVIKGMSRTSQNRQAASPSCDSIFNIHSLGCGLVVEKGHSTPIKTDIRRGPAEKVAAPTCIAPLQLWQSLGNTSGPSSAAAIRSRWLLISSAYLPYSQLHPLSPCIACTARHRTRASSCPCCSANASCPDPVWGPSHARPYTRPRPQLALVCRPAPLRYSNARSIVFWGQLVFNVPQQRDSHLRVLVSAQHIADELHFDLHLNLRRVSGATSTCSAHKPSRGRRG